MTLAIKKYDLNHVFSSGPEVKRPSFSCPQKFILNFKRYYNVKFVCGIPNGENLFY